MAMSKHELTEALRRNGYTLAEFAEEFGVATKTVYDWGSRYGVPRWVVRVLALMDQHGRAHVVGVRSQGCDPGATARHALVSPHTTTQETSQ